jgi:hypothetical protein
MKKAREHEVALIILTSSGAKFALVTYLIGIKS